MMKSIDWRKLGLRKNPFKIVPSREKGNLVWAGFNENKKKIEKIISESILTEDSKVVLIFSRFGGGKTHSTYYFSNQDNLPKDLKQLPEPFQIIVKTPQEGDKSSGELFKNVIEQIKWRNIEKFVKLLRQSEGDDESLSILEEWTNSEDLGRILWLMGEEDDTKVFIAQQVLFGQITATIKNALKIRRTISSNTDRANVISGLFKLISKYGGENNNEHNRRVILWIDELESLIYYTSKQYRPFSQFLREIIDVTESNFTLIISFSFSDPSDFQSIEIVLGEALVDRISYRVVFEEASIEEAKTYLSELLSHYRIEGFKNNIEYHPFTTEAVERLLERALSLTEKPRTPRTLNKWCLQAIDEAVNQGVLYNNTIDVNFIESVNFADS